MFKSCLSIKLQSGAHFKSGHLFFVRAFVIIGERKLECGNIIIQEPTSCEIASAIFRHRVFFTVTRSHVPWDICSGILKNMSTKIETLKIIHLYPALIVAHKMSHWTYNVPEQSFLLLLKCFLIH